MAILVDSKLKLTYEDYEKIPSDDGKRHEIIDGEHIVSPAPETYHQTLSRRIQFQLYRQIEETGLGVVFNAPTDLQLSQVDIVQPDLLVVLTAREEIVGPKKIDGPPDLVVEILSPSSGKNDQVLKKDLYAKRGVPEYWIVDPAAKAVERHLLQAGRYRLEGKHAGEVSFGGLPGVTVDLTKVW